MTTEDISGFMQRMRNLQIRNADRHLPAVSAFLIAFKARLPAFQTEARQIEANAAPQFNVFRVLRLARKEVLLHTPVLAELLNPRGSHGQGFLFLKSFFETAVRRGVREPAENFEDARWRIQVEVSAGDLGALDIVVRCPALSYLLVIENKIGASEQPKQLLRYHEWMQQQNCPEPQLVFLTPTGREATTLSSDKYIPLSYHHDIHPWLRDALERVQAPSVCEVLRQYLETIETC